MSHMAYVIRCPHCQKSMQIPDHASGKHVQCPSCKKPFAVPVLQPVGASVAAAPPAAKAAPVPPPPAQ
jgi:hypothetical protein